jgi:hypothetical protein
LSQNRSDKEKLEDSSTELHLERAPRTGSQREFDEVVPEFMHRAFYRSTEDEYQAVEAGGLKPCLTRKTDDLEADKVDEPTVKVADPPRPAPPVSAPPPEPLRTSESSVEREPLAPLRRSGSLDSEPEAPRETMKDTVAVPLRTMPQTPPPPPKDGSPPAGSKQSGINFPVVAALLFVIGLFIWREQTRPPIPAEQPLPVVQTQAVEQETTEPPALGEESPYPEMSPRVTAPVVTEQPQVEPVETATAEDSERAATLAEEAPEDTTTYPSREASAQRAAIMERMSDGTVTNMERTSREAPAPPPEDTSLFPLEEPVSQPVEVAPAQPETAETIEATTEDVISDSLFPTETGDETAPVAQPDRTQPVVTSEPPVEPPQPPVNVSPPPQPGQGEPYEIAEPTF